MVVKSKGVQLSPERKRQIAQWIVDHPNLTVKQIAIDLSIHQMKVYRIIEEFLDVRKAYKFKDVAGSGDTGVQETSPETSPEGPEQRRLVVRFDDRD